MSARIISRCVRAGLLHPRILNVRRAVLRLTGRCRSVDPDGHVPRAVRGSFRRCVLNHLRRFGIRRDASGFGIVMPRLFGHAAERKSLVETRHPEHHAYGAHSGLRNSRLPSGVFLSAIGNYTPTDYPLERCGLFGVLLGLLGYVRPVRRTPPAKNFFHPYGREHRVVFTAHLCHAGLWIERPEYDADFLVRTVS